MRKSIPWYIDVSGSNLHHEPAINKLIAKERRIKLFCFSTEIHETSRAKFKKGEFITTGGTDLNVVAMHILASGFKEVVIVSDGDSYPPDDDLKQRLEAKGVRLVFIWTVSGQDKNPLSRLSFSESYLYDLIT